MNHNKAVKSYLDYFSTLSEPGFAVMLKGNWGVGKTFFVKEWLDKHKDDQRKPLYVTLYGMTSFDEIETAFFQQIHPILSSKRVTTLGSIGQLLISTALNQDIIENKRRIFKRKCNAIPEYVVNERRIIVFDDLERCIIKCKDVMGYINRYVEHHGCNVIVMCNEDDIHLNDKQYARIKEKVIGRTFTIHANAQKTLDYFVAETDCERVITICTKAREEIIAIFNESCCDNLRVLKHAIADYIRFVEVVDEKFLFNDELAEHLMLVMMIISYEYKQGEISKGELSNVESSYVLNSIGHSKDFNKTVYGKLVEKYSTDKLHDMILDGKLWAEIIIDGEINATEINHAIGKSKYFIEDAQPNWVQLWHYFDSTEKEFEEALEAVSKEFSDCVHDEIGVVKHIGALLLRFSKMNLYGSTQEEILEQAKKNVDHLADIGKLISSNDNTVFNEDEAWGGLAFTDKDSDVFKALCSYICDKKKEIWLGSLPEKAIELLRTMSENTQLFHDGLVFRGGSDHQMYVMPIMAYVPVKEFADSFMVVTPNQKRTVIYALRKRYQCSTMSEEMKRELTWLESVVRELMKYRTTMKDGLNRRMLETLYIPELLEILRSNKLDNET